MSNPADAAPALAGYDYLLPSLGADMDEGRVVEWRVAVGDTVHRGDLMAVVETEKSDIDIEIWHDGVVEAFLVPIGELIEVGTPIVRLRSSESIAASQPQTSTPAQPEPAQPAPTRSPPAPTTTPAHVTAPPPMRRDGPLVPASPLARRLADERSLDEVMSTLNELVSAARSGNLRASWMTGSTITITNLGDTGADLVHGVISPPQVALVGFGRSLRRPWVIDDLVTIRPIVTATLAADHRATDGANGSRFLATVATHLEHPEDL